MDRLTAKSRQLTGFLEYLLQQQSNPRFPLITPSDPDQRGCQLSIRVAGADKSVFHRLSEQGVIADWRAGCDPRGSCTAVQQLRMSSILSSDSAWQIEEVMKGREVEEGRS